MIRIQIVWTIVRRHSNKISLIITGYSSWCSIAQSTFPISGNFSKFGNWLVGAGRFTECTRSISAHSTNPRIWFICHTVEGRFPREHNKHKTENASKLLVKRVTNNAITRESIEQKYLSLHQMFIANRTMNVIVLRQLRILIFNFWNFFHSAAAVDDQKIEVIGSGGGPWCLLKYLARN